jgi:hypothetical protein
MRTSNALAFLALTALGTQALVAQRTGGPILGVGVGLGSATMSVGGQSSSATGVTLHAGLGLLEAELQPFSITNPVRAEHFWSLYVLIGPRIRFSKALYIRPAVGLQFRRWSGPNPVTSNDQGLAIGVLAAYQVPLAGRWMLTPQAVGRWALIESEGNVTARLLGVRVQFSRKL